jgi:putative membrane protein
MMTALVIAFVATLHFLFFVIESFLWVHPWGRKIFRLTPEKAALTRSLALNQGVYNLFLSGGLFGSFFLSRESQILAQNYFLICVVIAGIVGALSVNRRIFWIQAVPAIIGLTLLSLNTNA